MNSFARRLLILAVLAASFAIPASAGAVTPAYSWTEAFSTPPGTSNTHQASFNGYNSSRNTSATVTCQVTNNGGNSSAYPCTNGNADGNFWFSAGISIIVEGAHTMIVVATASDGSGNQQTLTRNIVTDWTAPTATVSAGPSGNKSGHDFEFSFFANETSTFQCRLDGVDADYSSCTSSKSYTSVPDGPHTFYVRATDQAGNTGSAAARSFTVDNSPPIAVIGSGPDATTVNTRTPSWSFSSNRDDALYECSLDGAAFDDCTSPYTVQDPGLNDGDHTFAVRAHLAGPIDVQDPADSVSFAVDATPPTPSIASVPQHVAGSSASFEYSADEPVDHYICVLDPFGESEYFSNCPTTLTGLSAGQHQLLLAAVDEHGNVTPEIDAPVYTWTQYPSPPQTTIVTKPDPLIAANSASFKFSSTTGITFECSIDDAAFSTCASELTIAGLAPGVHTLKVRAKDPAGQTDPTPASASFTVAAPPKPQVTAPKIAAKSLGVTVSGAATIKVKVATCKTKRINGTKRKFCTNVAKGTATATAAGKLNIKLNKKLKKGVKYQVTILATDSYGQTSSVVKTLKLK